MEVDGDGVWSFMPSLSFVASFERRRSTMHSGLSGKAVATKLGLGPATTYGQTNACGASRWRRRVGLVSWPAWRYGRLPRFSEGVRATGFRNGLGAPVDGELAPPVKSAVIGFAGSWSRREVRLHIVNVEQLLAEEGNAGAPLRLRRLDALQPRPEPYFALLCQAHGTIHASSARIGNADSQAVVPMYRAFLNDAVESQAQLAITPEYSVPWAIITEIIDGTSRPPKGSLWVLGCESITPSELDTLRTTVDDGAAVRLIHECLEQQKRAQTAFVSPLVFVFWAVDTAGADVLVLLVQFKTIAARDADHVELQSLYLGTSVYKFTARAGDISLLALICSDAFAFTNDLVDEHCTNLLLVHIQLNQKPAHIDYSAYRSRLFSVASNNNVEVICLNWSANVLLEESAEPWNSIAGSAWYIAPGGLRPSDADVNLLHQGGMYYSIVGERWHAFYLSYAPHSVLVRKRPVFATGPQVLAARIPPQVMARRAWDSQKGAWMSDAANDGFDTFIQQYEPLRAILPQLCGQDPLAVERALELLEGPKGNVSRWHALKELSALKVADEESLRRVTVSQETDIGREGVAFRRGRARRAQTAATIPGQELAWPTPVADLAAGFRYRWTKDDPHSNVEPLAGGCSAAFVYLGENVEPDTLSNVYAKLKKARRMHAFEASDEANIDPNDAMSLAQDRLCVVYRQNHTLRFYRSPEYASISDPEGVEVDDIAGAQ